MASSTHQLSSAIVHVAVTSSEQLLLDEVFFNIQNNQSQGRGYQPKPMAEADNPYQNLYYSGY